MPRVVKIGTDYSDHADGLAFVYFAAAQLVVAPTVRCVDEGHSFEIDPHPHPPQSNKAHTHYAKPRTRHSQRRSVFSQSTRQLICLAK